MACENWKEVEVDIDIVHCACRALAFAPAFSHAKSASTDEHRTCVGARELASCIFSTCARVSAVAFRQVRIPILSIMSAKVKQWHGRNTNAKCKRKKGELLHNRNYQSAWRVARDMIVVQ